MCGRTQKCVTLSTAEDGYVCSYDRSIEESTIFAASVAFHVAHKAGVPCKKLFR